MLHVGFTSLKSCSLSWGPVFPTSLRVCPHGDTGEGGKVLLPCWPCSAPAAPWALSCAQLPFPQGRAVGHGHRRGEQRLGHLWGPCCAQQWGCSRVPVQAQAACEFTWIYSTVPSECDQVLETDAGCFEAIFLIKHWKSTFSRVVYFLQQFFWSSSCVSMGSSLLTGFFSLLDHVVPGSTHGLAECWSHFEGLASFWVVCKAIALRGFYGA